MTDETRLLLQNVSIDEELATDCGQVTVWADYASKTRKFPIIP